MASWLTAIPREHREKVRALYKTADGIAGRVEVLQKWHLTGQVNLKPVKSLEEFLRYVRLCSSRTSWFRGEDADYGHLVPKLYRGVDQKDVNEALKKERKYHQEFRRRARTFAPNVDPDDHWAWYFLVQHYGGPTRLLDWTQDAATALYFAVSTALRDDVTPVVYVLSPAALTTFATHDVTGKAVLAGRVPYPKEEFVERWVTNVQVDADSTTDRIPNSPIPLLPPHLDQRMEAQKSCFTLFGARVLGFDGTPHAPNFPVMSDPDLAGIAALRPSLIVCPCCGQRLVHKIVIDGSSCARLRGELARIGMTSARVFPGLEGLCKELADDLRV